MKKYRSPRKFLDDYQLACTEYHRAIAVESEAETAMKSSTAWQRYNDAITSKGRFAYSMEEDILRRLKSERDQSSEYIAWKTAFEDLMAKKSTYEAYRTIMRKTSDSPTLGELLESRSRRNR